MLCRIALAFLLHLTRVVLVFCLPFYTLGLKTLVCFASGGILVGLRESLGPLGRKVAATFVATLRGRPRLNTRLAFTPTDTTPLVSRANVGLSDNQD